MSTFLLLTITGLGLGAMYFLIASGLSLIYGLMIVSGGENVYPAEVEAVLHDHPAVADAAVVGVPDERWGEVCAAFVVAESSVSEEQLREHCRERLARFKVPKSFTFVDELPRNSMGKIQKSELNVPA